MISICMFCAICRLPACAARLHNLQIASLRSQTAQSTDCAVQSGDICHYMQLTKLVQGFQLFFFVHAISMCTSRSHSSPYVDCAHVRVCACA